MGARRIALQAVAAVAASFAGFGFELAPPAAAQSTQPVPGCDNMYCAVTETVKKKCQENSLSGCFDNAYQAALLGGISGAYQGMKQWCANNGGLSATLQCTPLRAAEWLGLVWPIPGSDFGGGAGADGEWIEDLCSFDWGIDADGGLIVPSIPLGKSGSPIMKGSDNTAVAPQPPTAATAYGTNLYIQAFGGADWKTGQDGSVLYAIHTKNGTKSANSFNKLAWIGCFRKEVNAGGNYYNCRSVPHYNGNTYVGRDDFFPRPTQWNLTGDYVACPQGGFSGQDVYFYWNRTGNTKNCVAYVPNYSLSKSGYAYGDKSSLLYPNWKNSPLSDQLLGNPVLKCPIAKRLIAKMTERLWAKAREADPSLPPVPTIKDEDVVNGGSPPLVEDLGDTSEDTSASTPTPYPTPEPTGTPTGGGDAPPPPMVSPNDPAIPEIDWWPDLPTIAVDLGSSTCPTYSVDLPMFEQGSFVVDSHCALIEQNRAAIGVLMLLVFGIIALFVVLKA